MPAALLARLSRSLPLAIALAILAVVAYFVLQFRYSPPRAKSILIRVFTWLTGVLSALFALVSLYAAFDSNKAVLELFLTFLATALIGLAVTRICHAVFVKRHPEYRRAAQRTSGTERFPWLHKGKRH